MCTTTRLTAGCFGCGRTIPVGAKICAEPMCEFELEEARLRAAQHSSRRKAKPNVCFGCSRIIPFGAVTCGDPVCVGEYEDAQDRTF